MQTKPPLSDKSAMRNPSAASMRAMEIAAAGPQGRLQPIDVPLPVPGAGEVRLRVAYAGLNRADIFQRLGQYPAPAGASPYPGLEVSGVVDAHGEGVDRARWPLGLRVCALTHGGGYAEAVCVPADQLLPVPEGWDMRDAAALPEAMLTVWLAVIETGGAQAGDAVLIQGGSSGIGSIGIPMLAMLGLRVFATARTREKCDYCWSQGAEAAFPTDLPDLAEAIRSATGGGVQVVLDMLGGAHLATALKSLAPGGRLVSIAFLNGTDAPLPLGALLMRNLSWHGITLRSRSPACKAAMAQALQARLWPRLTEGGWRPAIDRVFQLAQAGEAQARMESRLHLGKILLKVSHID